MVGAGVTGVDGVEDGVVAGDAVGEDTEMFRED